MLTKVDELHDPGIEEIARLADSNTPITITSNYKGIILTQPVHILNVEPGLLTIEAPDLAFCASLKKKIQLYSQTLLRIISARLLTSNLLMGRLQLADPVLTNQRWQDRHFERVQPHEPVHVYWERRQTVVRASLDNLSADGMSLLLPAQTSPQEEGYLFDGAAPVGVSLQLPGSDIPLEMRARVRHEQRIGRMKLIGVQLLGSRTQEKQLQRYVQARKNEIMVELEQISKRFLDQKIEPFLYVG